MTNELISIQQELTIAKQDAEIANLKFELQKVQAQKASRLEDSLFAPSLFNHYQKVAETLSRSAVIPTSYRGKPEDIFVAIAMGYQLGFPVEQSLQDIAVINGRPCVWGDGLLALALSHPKCEYINEEPIFTGQNITGYICTVKREGHDAHSKSFTIQDAERAGLIKKGGVWSQYPSRMLQMRARSLALRDRFADALRGIKVAEEVLDGSVIDGEIVETKEIKNEHKSHVDKLKNILKSNQGDSSIETDKESETDLKTEQEDNSLIVSEQEVLEIKTIMNDKGFDEARKLRAMDYFKITDLNQLTKGQYKTFLVQLSKA